VPVLCLLIKAGADMHAVNDDGQTASEVAHEYGNELAELLLIRAARV
jgi:ankyrin repeat protein